MLRYFAFVLFSVFSLSPFSALGSYQMFCELDGEVVSTPIQSNYIEFAFLVASARDVEVEVLGSGEPDCHLIEGKRIRIVLEYGDAGDPAQIENTARLTLERYELDVVHQKSGNVVRSIKYVRKGK